MKTTEQCLVQTRPGTAEREIEILRKEVADLASAFNGLYGLRLIRLFNLYRRMRHQITERLLRLARRKTISKQDAIDQVAIIPPVPGEELQGQAYDVVFMSCGDWQWRYQRPQHLANQWADHGHRVFFLSPEFRPQVNPAYMKPARPYTIRWVREAVFEVHLAGPRELLPRNKRMFASDLQKLIKACEALQRDFQIEAGVSVVELPFWAPLALTLRKQFGWKMIYDFIDRNYGVYPKAHSMIAQETELLREADLVVATARLLQDEARDYNSNILLIPNAAEVEHFAQAASGNLAESPDEEAPTIGYFGNLAPWFDIELVHTIARQHPEWIFVLIGSGTANTQRLSQLTNVRLLGEIPYLSLPKYLSRFNVCIIPFKVLPVTAATDPVKLYEYLAAGKPVVATNLPELRPYGDVIYLADSSSSFESLIDLALAENSEVKQQQRREFAQNYTWEKRFQDYDRAIRDLFEETDTTVRASIQPKPSNLQGSSLSPPLILELEPSAIRIDTGFHYSGEVSGKLHIQGQFLTSNCVVLIDEQAVPTKFVSSTELHCQLPVSLYRTPGCLMVSVMDQNTWKQSNRRVLLVEGI